MPANDTEKTVHLAKCSLNRIKMEVKSPQIPP